MSRMLTLLAFSLIYLTTAAQAHGTAYFISTPVSPPEEMVWAGYLGLAILALTTVFLLRYGASLPWWASIGGGLLAVALPSYLFSRYGDWHPGLSTGPEPGLAWGEYPAFWGAGWGEVGDLFIWWNLGNFFWLLCGVFYIVSLRSHVRGWSTAARLILLLGIGTLIIGEVGDIYPLTGGNFSGGFSSPMFFIMAALFVILLIGGYQGYKIAEKRGTIVIGCLITYVLSISPYVASGALTHGACGVYTSKECTQHLSVLSRALLRYAAAHEKRLPPGKSMREVYQQIAPYIDESKRSDNLITCSIDALYEHDPQPYHWYTAAAEKQMEALRKASSPTPLISCPHFNPVGINRYHTTLYSCDLLEMYDSGEEFVYPRLLK